MLVVRWSKIVVARATLVASIVLTIGAAAGKAGQAGPANDVAAGRDLARQVCTYCHVISVEPQRQPDLVPPAPDFREIASRPYTTAESLKTFLGGTHKMTMRGKMPDFNLDTEQVKVLASFILSLRTAHAEPSR